MVIVWMWGEIGGQNAMALAFKCLLCCVLLCVCVCVYRKAGSRVCSIVAAGALV